MELVATIGMFQSSHLIEKLERSILSQKLPLAMNGVTDLMIFVLWVRTSMSARPTIRKGQDIYGKSFCSSILEMG